MEAALVLPAMLFLILCAIQLAQIQQARLLAEYAAFNAARAGIVHSGDPKPMERAALLSVLPSTARTDDFTRIAKAFAILEAKNTAGKPFGIPLVRVFVHGPRQADFAKYGAHLNGREIDFDDVRPGATEATLLEIQVRYLYEMRVPFANKIIQTIWMATHVGLGNKRALDGWTGWDLTSPKALVPTGPDAVSLTRDLALAAKFDDGTPEGVNLASLVLLGSKGRYYFPVQAFYTMRMQSNPFRKWAHP